MFREIRRLFVAGLLVTIPIVTTVWVVVAVFNLFDSWFHDSWLQDLQIVHLVYENLGVKDDLRPYGVGFLTTVIFILAVGTLTRYWVGLKVVGLLDAALLRVPFVGGIYGALKQVSSALFGGNRQVFDKVVILEYPRKGIYSLGFVTREGAQLPIVPGHPEQKEVRCLFVPTTPNPTSGVFVMAPANEVIETSMSAEEAMKLVISAGMVMPGDEEPASKDPVERRDPSASGSDRRRPDAADKPSLAGNESVG